MDYPERPSLYCSMLGLGMGIGLGGEDFGPSEGPPPPPPPSGFTFGGVWGLFGFGTMALGAPVGF